VTYGKLAPFDTRHQVRSIEKCRDPGDIILVVIFIIDTPTTGRLIDLDFGGVEKHAKRS
jgi:hypothetical protein